MPGVVISRTPPWEGRERCARGVREPPRGPWPTARHRDAPGRAPVRRSASCASASRRAVGQSRQRLRAPAGRRVSASSTIERLPRRAAGRDALRAQAVDGLDDLPNRWLQRLGCPVAAAQRGQLRHHAVDVRRQRAALRSGRGRLVGHGHADGAPPPVEAVEHVPFAELDAQRAPARALSGRASHGAIDPFAHDGERHAHLGPALHHLEGRPNHADEMSLVAPAEMRFHGPAVFVDVVHRDEPRPCGCVLIAT